MLGIQIRERDVCRAVFISSITAVPWSHMPFYTGPELVEIKAGKMHVAQLCAVPRWIPKWCGGIGTVV